MGNPSSPSIPFAPSLDIIDRTTEERSRERRQCLGFELGSFLRGPALPWERRSGCLVGSGQNCPGVETSLASG